MAKLTFTKQSISPAIYYGKLEGYARLFAVVTKAKTGAEYQIEIDGLPAILTDKTLADAKETVRYWAASIEIQPVAVAA